MNRTQPRFASQRARRGSLMVWMAVILFVFIIIAAMVLDLGRVLFERRRMQSVVNSAAREELRVGTLRGEALPGEILEEMNYSEVFGEDYTFALNEDNNPEGDIVRGKYSGDLDHQEDANYSRVDFNLNPDEIGEQPDAVLVRLRRTGETPIEGVSSSLPRIPYLFRRGVAYDESTQAGVAIRATAIAQARPALAVGVPLSNEVDEQSIPGAAPWAISISAWLHPVVDEASGDEMNQWIRGSDQTESHVFPWSATANDDSVMNPQNIRAITPRTLQIGDPISPGNVGISGNEAYMPIFDPFNDGELELIIGFGWLHSYTYNATSMQVTIVRKSRHQPLETVAAKNASAQLLRALEYPQFAKEVFSRLKDLEESKDAEGRNTPLLRAPALVRATAIPPVEFKD